MKTHILIQLVYCVWFVRSDENSDEKIVDYKFEKDTKGPYSFRFSTNHGYEREEIAELLHEGTEFESIFLRGSYQYLGADGKTYTIKYRADDNGFHPEGDHIEVPPFVPWPSKIDIRFNEDQLKDAESVKMPKQKSPNPFEISTTRRPPKFQYRYVSTSTVPSRYSSTSKPDSTNSIKFLTTQRPPKFQYRTISTSTVPSKYLTTPKTDSENSIKFLTTQRPPKFEYKPIGSSTIPSRYFTTSKPSFVLKNNGRQSKKLRGFSSNDKPERMMPKITQQYIPTSTIEPPNKGDVVGSSTAKNPKFFSVPLITREYIPTSSTPLKLRGDIEGFSSVSDHNLKYPQSRGMSKYSNDIDTRSKISDTVERQRKTFIEGKIHPTIIYEGRPFDDESSKFEDSSTVSIPESKAFGFRTKSRKPVRDFVTTEYPSVRSRLEKDTSRLTRRSYR